MGMICKSKFRSSFFSALRSMMGLSTSSMLPTSDSWCEAFSNISLLSIGKDIVTRKRAVGSGSDPSKEDGRVREIVIIRNRGVSSGFVEMGDSIYTFLKRVGSIFNGPR